MRWKVNSFTFSGLKCDKPGCGYRDDSVTYAQYASSVGRPCPVCGSNLLTEQDQRTCKRIEKIVLAVNILFAPYCIVRGLLSKKYRDQELQLLAKLDMDGSGSVKVVQK